MTKPKRDNNKMCGKVDLHIAECLRQKRLQRGLTQVQLADLIGVTYQQLHKYEHCVNRLSAGRLYELAQALDTPVIYFFEGLGDEMDSTQIASAHPRLHLALAQRIRLVNDQAALEALGKVLDVLVRA